MNKTLFFVITLTALVGCNKKDSPNVEKVSAFEEHLIEQEISAYNFNNLIKVGTCWSHKRNPKEDLKAKFIKDVTINSPAYLLISIDQENKVAMFAQPEPDTCNQTLENSAKCNYWIRVSPISDMSIFYASESEPVPCPKGISIPEIVQRASPSDKQRYDFTKI